METYAALKGAVEFNGSRDGILFIFQRLFMDKGN
jgi:hypothetical protein